MSKARILVVDDEAAMLRTMQRVLADHHDVACARSPSEAIEMLHAFKPDIGILDLRMPEMDGFELLARLKKLRPDLDLIVMTGSVTELDAKLIRALREKAFYFIQKPFDREVLITLVSRCLELRRLTEANRRHLERLEGELEAARAFQKSLLPSERRDVEGVSIAARYLPCVELCGDFFDYAPAGKGRATVLVADVSGHGARAAMLTGIVKSAFHSAQAEAYEPRSVLMKIASAIRPLADNLLVTAFCARICSRESFVEYGNAGHPPGVLWSAGGEPAHLDSTGPIISPAWPSASWDQVKVPFDRQDRLLLYTDGLIEAQGEGGEFGIERLVGLLRPSEGSRRDPAEAILARVLDGFRRFLAGRPAGDDLTMLLAHCSETASGDARRRS